MSAMEKTDDMKLEFILMLAQKTDIKDDGTYSKYYDEFVVLFGTGMRVSEFCGLTKKDVDFENRKIHVDHQLCRERQRDRRCYFVEKTKTEAGRRDIPMTDEVFAALKNIVNNRPHVKTEMIINGYSGFLLIDKNGNPKVALHIENEFRWAEHKYKKLYPNKPLPHITPHVARHTFATRMAQSGTGTAIHQACTLVVEPAGDGSVSSVRSAEGKRPEPVSAKGRPDPAPRGLDNHLANGGRSD